VGGPWGRAMSPLRPGRKELYGADWPVFSKRIRFERAEGRCECTGECIGEPHPFGRCARNNDERGVVLTVAHLCHDESCRDETHVKAMCQGCHLRYDAKYHAQNASLTRDAKRGQQRLALEYPVERGGAP
jgi:hypothetical protein